MDACAIAVALMEADVVTGPARRLFKELTRMDARSVRFVPVGTSRIDFGESNHHTLVLGPGTHACVAPPPWVKFLALIGVSKGRVRMRAGKAHAVMVESHQSVTMRNIVLMPRSEKANPEWSAICVEGNIGLHGCQVPSWPAEAALTIHGGSCVMDDCEISNTGKQAIEVRMGGSLIMSLVSIRNCVQGVIAYGGAQNVRISNCLIAGSKKEGVLIQGSRVNAPTQSHHEICAATGTTDAIDPRSLVSHAAHQWGLELGIDLHAIIQKTVVSGSGSFGVSCDYGAHVTLLNCTFRSNQPSAVFVKGDTELHVFGCRIAHGDHVGIHVGFNYDASVAVKETCFAGRDRGLSILEERCLPGAGRTRSMGMWSRPVDECGTRHFTKGAGMPPVDDDDTFMGKLGLRMPRKGPVRATSDAGWLHSLFGIGTPTVGLYQQQYGIGNVQGRDIFAGEGAFEGLDDDEPLRVLLGACGDIRNVLKTVAELDKNRRAAFVLNDRSITSLARNLLHLTLIAQGAAAADLLSIWADHELSRRVKHLLDFALASLIDNPMPAWVWLEHGDRRQHVRADVARCLEGWRASTVTRDELLRERWDGNLADERRIVTSVALTAVGMGFGAAEMTRYRHEIVDYVVAGSLPSREERPMANPCRLDERLQYAEYWSSSIYRSVALDAAEKSKGKGKRRSLYERLVATLGSQVQTLREALKKGRVQIYFTAGDFLNALVNPRAMEFSRDKESEVCQFNSFHQIDCSNVSDYIGIRPILQAVGPWLDAKGNSQVHLQSMHLDRIQVDSDSDPAMFVLERSIGSSVDLFESAVGLRKVEVRTDPMRGIAFMSWKRLSSGEGVTGSIGRTLSELIRSVRALCFIEGGDNAVPKQGASGTKRTDTSPTAPLTPYAAGLGLGSVTAMAHFVKVANDVDNAACAEMLRIVMEGSPRLAWSKLQVAIVRKVMTLKAGRLASEEDGLYLCKFRPTVDLARLAGVNEPYCIVIGVGSLPPGMVARPERGNNTCRGHNGPAAHGGLARAILDGLDCGGCEPDDDDDHGDLQVIESVAFEPESGLVRFLLPCPASDIECTDGGCERYATLCIPSRPGAVGGGGLVPVSPSVAIARCRGRPLVVEKGWEGWRVDNWRQRPRLDVSGLERAVHETKGWKTVEVKVIGGGVACDVMMPRPVGDHAAPLVKLEDVGTCAVFTMTGGNAMKKVEHRVTLPLAVVARDMSIKIIRSLGLLSVLFAQANQFNQLQSSS
ncbi:Zinc finger CCCH domain-containing protein 7A [Irineochytrium annulatum]|nr:Zinc finger CCCH domain-containing protein 7A [Irineochytrium annulatum]